MDSLTFLDVDDVLEIHAEQLALYGGMAGIRSRDGLESAIAQPAATMFGEYLHKDLVAMAAAYAFHVSQNQPCIDGNKRTGTVAALVFLKTNGFELRVDPMDLAQTILRMGAGELTKEDVATYIRANTHPSTAP